MKELFTSLKNRKLRYDGVSIVAPSDVSQFLLLGASPRQLRIEEETWETRQHNSNVETENELGLPIDPVSINLAWQLPESFLSLDIGEAVFAAFAERHAELSESYSSAQIEQALDRIADELQEITNRGMIDFIRTVIYILDVFREKDIVWGVGRGSSCASYVLFILGLHSVDCVKFNVPFSEFFHD